MLILTNVMEYMVLETIGDVFNSDNGKGYCHCQRCKLDIAAIVLNKLPPSYVVTYEGEVKKRSNALAIQYKADILREVTHAMRTVAIHIHHNREDG